jgi:prepilin-type N-terminal cleavage/methylation domain-containing protein/prepilin-type processing-associated H-X9-DG protein
MKTNNRTRLQRGFTLVELLVVIAIIGVLVALLLPAIQAAREASRRVSCSNNIRQIALAVLNHEGSKKRLPAGSTTAEVGQINGPYLTTWTVDILPFIEQSQLFDQWDSQQSLEHANNRALRETFVSSYLCPSDQGISELIIPASGPLSDDTTTGTNNPMPLAPGSYRAMSGSSLGASGDHFWDNPKHSQLLLTVLVMPLEKRGPMYSTSLRTAVGNTNQRALKPVKLREIDDGTSNTILVGEYQTATVPSRRTFWAYAYTSYNQSSAIPESRTLQADFEKCYAIGPGGIDHRCPRGWGSFHNGGIINFALCDGSVRPISQDIDMAIFVAAATISNGESAQLSEN